MSKMSRTVLLTLCVLCVMKHVSPFDLHTLLSQGTSGLKAMMTPELLNKMKTMLPSGSGSPADIHEIERLLSKLRPAEGRFDPAMLELLASMDASKRINYASSTPRSRTGKSTSSATPHLEIFNSPEDSIPSTTSHSYTTEGRPKFSSKFRLEDQKDPQIDTTSPMGIDHVIDPNLRNHRLYDVDQDQRERYENYENFTTIDQLEDLIADETSPQVVVSIPKSPKNKLSSGKNRGKLRDSDKRKHPSNEEIPVTTSFEELISLETAEENESMAHEREALKRASTEKTVVYSHSMTAPSSERPYGTTMAFRPSPVDLSAPMYSYDGEHNIDDYYVPMGKPKLKLKRPRRPHAHRKSSSSSRPGYNPKFDDSFHYDDDYEKEQPDYQNVVNYLKLQGQGQPPVRSTTPHTGHTGQEVYHQQHSIPQPLPPPPRQPHINILNPNIKHDRILTPADMSTAMHPQNPSQPFIQPTGAVYPEQYNRYIPAASENVYNDVHPSQYNNYYQQQHQQQPIHSPSGTDLAYSAGQNYYHQSNHGHGGEGHGHQQQQQHHGHDHHHQGYSSGGGSHHYPHHVEDSSSWSSTFLILGGLIALSAAIAFLLPSFITGAPPAGGKDAIDKNSNSDNDLWTEIKGLYNDIINLARGDYSQFHKYNNEQNLPKINIIDAEEEEEVEEEKKSTKKPVRHRNKGQNSFNKRVGGPAYHEDESSEEQHGNDSSSSPPEDHERHEEDEENSPESLQPPATTSQDHQVEIKERPKKKRVVDKDSLAYAIYGKGGVASNSKYSYDFANAFNQTLNAWEKVPLITN